MTVTANFVENFSITDVGTTATDKILSGAASLPSLVRSFENGTGTNKVNKVWRSYRTLTAGSSETIDLSGTLTDHEGGTVAFAGIKTIYFIVVSPDGTKKIQVGNAASNSFQGPLSSGATIDVFDFEKWMNPYSSGWAVSNGSTDNLKINNPGAGTVNYFIIALGT